MSTKASKTSKTSSKKTKKEKKTTSQTKQKTTPQVKQKPEPVEYTVKPELLDEGSLMRITCTCLDRGFKTIFQKDFTFDEIKEITNHYEDVDDLESIFTDIQTHIVNQEQVKLTNLNDTIDLVIEFSEDDNVTLTLKKIFAGPVVQKKKKENKYKTKIDTYVKTVELLKTELGQKLSAATLDVDSVAQLQKDKTDLDKKLKERNTTISELNDEIKEFKKQTQSANNKIRKKEGELEEKDQLITELQEEISELKRLQTEPNESIEKYSKNEKYEKRNLKIDDDISNLKSENLRLMQELQKYKNESSKYSLTQQEFNKYSSQQEFNKYSYTQQEINNQSVEIPKFSTKKKGRVPFIDSEDLLNISDIFLNIEEISMIESYLNFGNLKFALIYKASRDGDKAEIFHYRVSESVDTLIVIKTTDGKRFGGFTKETWDGINVFKKDNEAFIFSLDNFKCYDCNQEIAIWCYPNYGPIFGGYQIDIFDNFMSNDSNKTALKGVGFNTEEDFELNGGVENFIVEELEVYHIEPIGE